MRLLPDGTIENQATPAQIRATLDRVQATIDAGAFKDMNFTAFLEEMDALEDDLRRVD